MISELMFYGDHSAVHEFLKKKLLQHHPILWGFKATEDICIIFYDSRFTPHNEEGNQEAEQMTSSRQIEGNEFFEFFLKSIYARIYGEGIVLYALRPS